MDVRIRAAIVINRLNCKPEVAARIRRLNDYDGIWRDGRIKGYHPTPRAPSANAVFSVMSPRLFVERYGRRAYDSVPRHALLRFGHRKGIAHEYIQDNFPRSRKD